MNRPVLEVADIVRQAGPAYIERHRSQLAWPHLKALQAVQNCRTAALGGHLDSCLECGYQAISYNSCRNRHCPKCQTAAREQGLAARSAELLPVPYYHVVFTLPRASPRSCCRTNDGSTLCCFGRAPKRCWQWRRTRSTWERRSAFSASCTLGGSASTTIRMFTVWCRAAVYPGTEGNGSTRPVAASFCRCAC